MRVAQDDEFRGFVAARWNALVRTAYLLTGDQQLAEDLVQTALEKTCRHWSSSLVLRFFEDMSEQQVADALGIGLGTVKSTSHRALAHLRAALDESVVTSGGDRR